MSQPISGKDGQVLVGDAVVAEVTRWRLQKDAATRRYASNATGGCKRTLPGVQSGGGSIEFKWDAEAPSPVAQGAAITLLLFLDATHFYSVPAVVQTVKLLVDIDTGEPIGGAAEFETDCPWIEPTVP
jgi:hypothetical protein